MIQAAMKNERIVQCGTLNRSADYAITARDYIQSGELGDIVTVHAMELTDGPVLSWKGGYACAGHDRLGYVAGAGPKVPYNESRHKSWVYFWTIPAEAPSARE